MAKKKKTEKQKLTQIKLKHKREAMMEAGAYDGRYKPRVFKDKSKYSRKNKKGGKDIDGEL
jgi:hypothetical protein